MKNKGILILMIALLLIIVGFMARDLFFAPQAEPKNPYEYNVDQFKKADSALLCYREVEQIQPKTEILNAIAIDKNDRLYVSGKEKLFVYDANFQLVHFFETDSQINDHIKFSEDIYCISISEDGTIYLGMVDHIEVYSASGGKIASWESRGEGAIFTSIAQTETSVFVADAGNKIVYHYNHKGDLLNTIDGKNPDNPKGFIIPSAYFDLLIGRNDELWIVNPGLHQLGMYRPNGELISSWGETSMRWEGFCGCCNPSHIAMLSDGSFVTSEKGIERVKIYHPDGEFKCVVAAPDDFIDGTRDLDLSVDSKDRIYVMDKEKGLIRIFDKK